MVKCSCDPEVQWEQSHIHCALFMCGKSSALRSQADGAAVGELEADHSTRQGGFRSFQKRLSLGVSGRVRDITISLTLLILLRLHQWSTSRELGRPSAMGLGSRIQCLMAPTASPPPSCSSLVTSAARPTTAKSLTPPKPATPSVSSCPTSSALWWVCAALGSEMLLFPLLTLPVHLEWQMALTVMQWWAAAGWF